MIIRQVFLAHICSLISYDDSLFSFVAILFLVKHSSAAALTGKFSVNGSDYICRFTGQTYQRGDNVIKIFGKHLKGNVAGREVTYGNGDVTVVDASYLHNDIQLVPTTVIQLFSNLREMRMEAMNLKVLNEDSFSTCGKLRSIIFGYDNIESISAGVFRDCGGLEALEFNNNVIDEIDDDAFKGLLNLKKLTLIRNNLDYVSAHLLSHLESLVQLTITDNKIIKLHPDIFIDMAGLRILELQNNELTSISSLLFRGKPNLESVNLSNNSIDRIENNLLENWPNNAALNLLHNECIDESFDELGTDKVPMSDVVGDFEQCFQNFEHTLKVKRIGSYDDSKLSNEDDYEGDELSEHHSKHANSKDKEGDSHDKSNDDLTTSLETTVNRPPVEKTSSERFENSDDKAYYENMFIHDEDDEIHSKAHDENTKSESDEVTNKELDSKIKSEVPHSFDPDYPESNDKADNIDDQKTKARNNSDDKSVSAEKAQQDSTKHETVHAHDHSRDSDRKQSLDSVESDEKLRPSKHDSKLKKSSEVTDSKTVTSPFDLPVFDEPINDTVYSAEDYDASVTESMDETTRATTVSSRKPYIHTYEQANSRFFINAREEYACVINNAKNTLRQVNTDHIDGYGSEDVELVYFRNSNLVHIPRVIFDEFPNLKVLSVEGCGIKVMDTEMLEECGKLQHLDLRNNTIRHIYGSSLKMCPMIETVDLTDNPVEIIESSIFECNPKLNITLGSLKLVSFP